MSYRTERDPLGELQVPADVYYGVQTARTVENFPIMPVIAWNATRAASILREAMNVLRVRTVDGIAANADRARELLDRTTATATALSPYIGYAATAGIAKEAVLS